MPDQYEVSSKATKLCYSAEEMKMDEGSKILRADAFAGCEEWKQRGRTKQQDLETQIGTGGKYAKQI